MKERIGVIDLGTNTFHLLVAEVGGGAMSIIHRERQPVKIGMGGINQGVIRDEAIERAIQCLSHFKTVIDEMNVSRVQALGTSALRSAVNGTDVLRSMRDATGIDVQVISGDQEAEYIYFGVRSAMDLGTSPSLIVDIGGGSVEFIIANKETIFWKVSLNIGAQRMLERFHRHDPIIHEELNALENFYNEALVPLEKVMAQWNPNTLIGSSGTFDTLSEIHCIRHGITYGHDQGETPLGIDSFLSIHHDLIAKNRDNRMKIPGMIPMRVDMIVVASCLISYLIGRFSFDKIRVSSYSLKEGVLAKFIAS